MIYAARRQEEATSPIRFFIFLEKIGKAIVLERRALAEMENYNLCLLSLGKRKLLQV